MPTTAERFPLLSSSGPIDYEIVTEDPEGESGLFDKLDTKTLKKAAKKNKKKPDKQEEIRSKMNLASSEIAALSIEADGICPDCNQAMTLVEGGNKLKMNFCIHGCGVALPAF